MRKTVISLLAAALLLSAVGIFSGCEEEAADTSTMRRARLVAEENIELKKQLGEKDKEIERQKQLVEECKQDRAKAEEQTGSTMLQMLKNMADSSKDVERLTEENAKLKERIAELEAKLGEK